MAYFSDPTTIAAILAGTLALIFFLADFAPLKKLFEIIPPVIWAYFIPMMLTTFEVLPDSSAAYDWIRIYLLPLSLFLLMLTVDVPAILKLGKLAIIMMLVGTAGIVIGGPVAYWLFQGVLEPEAWKGFAALSGSWIGGTANMVAIQQSVGAPDSALGPVIVVDTVVGYGWMGVLIFLSGFQKQFDRWVKADTKALDEINASLLALDTTRTPASLPDLGKILGLGLIATVAAIALSKVMPVPAMDGTNIITASTWAVLIAVTVGLALSFTPLRKLERPGASRLGYLALYLLIASIGAKADLKAVLDAPWFLAAGVVWISIHIGLLMLAAKLLRAPLFFVATGSMANIGGAASAPVVAGVYLPSMAPVGLLMGVSGYILGIYAALFCAYLLSLLGAG